MKNETKVSDLRAFIAAETTKELAIAARNRAAGAITPGNTVAATQAAQDAVSAVSDHLAADTKFRKLPPDRRTLAEKTHTIALNAAHAASLIGGSYSGETNTWTVWGIRPQAETLTSSGDRYSRGCTYRKTDATHRITLDPEGCPALLDNPELVSRSAAEGAPLIALYPDNSAVWVMTKNKRISPVSGWVVYEAGTCFHSTVSPEHARAGLQRKLDIAHRAAAEARQSRKETRRVRLIARLCGGITATIADAKRMGYCDPGIQAFQAKHRLGDTVSLPQLLSTGNPSAVALALSVARGIRKTETSNI